LHMPDAGKHMALDPQARSHQPYAIKPSTGVPR